MYDYCESRQIRGEEPNSNGLYFDVWANGRRYMLDASPDDVPYSKLTPGTVVVRDSSYDHKKPVKVGVINMFEAKGLAALDEILNIRVPEDV
tara:strand:- start:88 stop:363 length:276 start_codon:yes stop_codon:yes gene_type:complete